MRTSAAHPVVMAAVAVALVAPLDQGCTTLDAPLQVLSEAVGCRLRTHVRPSETGQHGGQCEDGEKAVHGPHSARSAAVRSTALPLRLELHVVGPATSKNRLTQEPAPNMAKTAARPHRATPRARLL